MSEPQLGLGRRIRHLRSRRGLSQNDLATRAGITRRTVQRIEAGDVQPYDDTLRRVSRALEVEVEELTTADPAPGTRRQILFHLSPLAGLLIPLAQILAPVSMWLVYRREEEALNGQIREIVLFHGTTTLLLITGLVLASFSRPIGYVLAGGTVLFCTGLTLWNAYRISETGTYRYFPRFGSSAAAGSS